MNDKRVYKRSEIASLARSFLPALKLLQKRDALRMAGATAFFTTFALPPIVFILAQLFGLFFTPQMVGRGLIENISNNLGTEGAQQVRGVIRSIRGFNDNWYVIVLGFCFLLFVATTLFVVIRNSLDDIWETTEDEKKGFLAGIRTRLLSFAVILMVGLLFLADLFLKSVESVGGKYFDDVFKGGSLYFKTAFGELTSILIVAVWFIMLFRFLTAAKPRWKAVVIGGFLTAILFTIGRFILRTLLIEGNVGKLYGASGSLVLVLLFVFYTSLIMYYGACYVAVYSARKGWPMTRDSKKPVHS